MNVQVLLTLLIGILILVILILIRKLQTLQRDHATLAFNHRSMFVKHGQSLEQLFPFASTYPYNPRNFRFIGDPIDGVSFEDDKIVFIEFKSGSSALSQRQKRMRDLIQSKKVEFKEIREPERTDL